MADETFTPAERTDVMVANWFKSNIPVLIMIGGVFATQVSQNATTNEKLDASEKYRTARSQQTDSNFEKVNTRIDGVADIPLRVKALEEQSKSLASRLDRIADAIVAGQEVLRRDLANSTDTLRKDLAGVVTKVEVLSDRIGSRAQPTALRNVPDQLIR